MAAPSAQRSTDVATARLMLVLLSLGWGVTWSTMRIALMEVPPFSMRVASMAIGAATLGLLTWTRRRSFALHTPVAAMHVVVAGFFNVVAFSLFTPFAQLYAATSRVTILVYTMPIWASLLARVVLGERFTPPRAAALALCVAGLAVLVYPLIGAGGLPLGIVLALGAGDQLGDRHRVSQVGARRRRPDGGDVLQIVVGFVAIGACQPLVEGSLHLWPIQMKTLVALVFSGLVGSGLAYFLWFDIIRRLPAMTASLGVLSVPAVGIVASMVMLGERPTLTDISGFALILAASGCVLFAPGPREKAAE